MIKKLIIIKALITLILISATASAALQWDVAAYIWTGSAIVITAASMGTATPLIVLMAGGSIGFHAGVLGLYWNDINAPKTSTGATAVKGYSVVIDPNQPLVTPSSWTSGTQQTDYEPTPPQESLKNTPLSFTVYNNGGCTGTVVGTQCKISSVNVIQVIDTIEKYLLPDCHDHDYPPQGNTTGRRCLSATFQDDTNLDNFGKVVYSYEYYGGVNGSAFDEDVNGSLEAYPNCEAGYSNYNNLKQFNCILTDPSVVKKPKDETCEVRVKTGKFVNAKNDPDCETTVVTGINTSQIQAITPDKAVYLVTSPTGDVSVYEKFYNASTNKTITAIANIGANANVNYLQTVNALGNQVAINPATSAGTGDSGNGTGTGTGASGEGAATNGKLDEIFKDGTILDKSDISISNDIKNPFGDIFNPLKNFNLPVQNGTCPTAVFHLFEKDFNFDQHCQIFDENKGILQGSMIFVYLITALYIVLGA